MLALRPKLPAQQPVQVRLKRLNQLPLLIEHEVQRLHIRRVRGSAFHGDILSNTSPRESARGSYLRNSWRWYVQSERRQSPDAREVHAIEQQRQLMLGQLDRDAVASRPLALAAQSLVPDRQAIAVPDQRFDPIGALAAEQEQSPDNGLLPSASVIVAHRPSKDRRMSTGLTAMKMRVFSGSLSIEPRPVRAPGSEMRPGVWVAKVSTNGTPNAIDLVVGKEVERVEFPFEVAVGDR